MSVLNKENYKLHEAEEEKDSFSINSLSWDKDYFGVTSSRVNLTGEIPKEEQKAILEQMKKYDFNTIVNFGNKAANNLWIRNRTNAFLTDINIQFNKSLKEEPLDKNKEIKVYSEYPFSVELLDITKRAFIFSRFFNDPYLDGAKAKNIYVEWVKNSFENENKYFVINKRNDIILGFLIFSVDNNIATVELLAVDPRHKRKRVGKNLISKFEYFVHNMGIEELRVGTQVNNTLAMNFYNSCGYSYAGCSSIYHYWPKK